MYMCTSYCHRIISLASLPYLILNMTPRLFVKTYHLSTFSIILSSFIYNQLYVKDEHGGGLLDYKGFGGKFKYLTFWFFVC